MALTKEQLIEQGLSEEIAENILNQFFNFVENSWWNKKNHQYDNLKNNFV